MSIRDLLMAAAGSGGASPDPYFHQNVLLLRGEGQAGYGYNASFQDSSSYARALTRQGDCVQGSFSPFNSDWSCGDFDGASYLQFPSNAANFGAGDWTVEFWMSYAGPDGPGVVCQATNTSAGNTSWGFFVGYGASGNMALYLSDGSVYFAAITGSTQFIADGKWRHFAATRSGATVRLFIDGVLAGSVNVGTTALGNGTANVRVGAQASGGYAASNCMLSNVRIVKGTALYTANFTPPSSALTAIAGTTLLTCCTNRHQDKSTFANVPTIIGTPRVTNHAPFARAKAYDKTTDSGSYYCDGAGDGISFAAIDLVGAFTLEGWFYPMHTSGTKSQCLFGNGSPNLQLNIDEYSYGGIGYYNSGNRFDIGGENFFHGSWNHFAFVRSGTTVRLYINGVDQGYTVVDGGTCRITSVLLNLTYGLSFLGHASNIRISDVARYNANFTPPAAPFTSDANTLLLLKGEGGNIIDSTRRHNVETYSNTASISTTQKKEGASSIYLDGAAYTFLQLPYNDDFWLGRGDWTMETWAYITTHGELFGAFSVNLPYPGFLLSTNFSGTGKLTLFIAPQSGTYGTDTQQIQSSGTVPTGQWTHLAATKQGNSIRLFIDGSLDTTATFTMTGGYIGRQAQPINIGSDSNSNTTPGRRMAGYLDGVRITKGVARYTASFTPPVSFPEY